MRGLVNRMSKQDRINRLPKPSAPYKGSPPSTSKLRFDALKEAQTLSKINTMNSTGLIGVLNLMGYTLTVRGCPNGIRPRAFNLYATSDSPLHTVFISVTYNPNPYVKELNLQNGLRSLIKHINTNQMIPHPNKVKG